jgi:hypothetical protein
MYLSEVRTLEELKQVEPRLAEALVGTSLDFHLPDCRNVDWEPERKRYQPKRLILRPSRKISRAWQTTFLILMDRLASRRVNDYFIPDQEHPLPEGKTPNLYLELPNEDATATKKIADAVKTATMITNAVTADAAAAARAEHMRLAAKLGFGREQVGFAKRVSAEA